MEQKYFHVDMSNSLPLNYTDQLICRLNDIALECGHIGNLDYSMDEKTVDELLGADAYSGGELPSSVFDKLKLFENNQTQDNKKIFYFDSRSCAEDFLRSINSIKLSAKIEEIEDFDWISEWKSEYKPIIINEHLIIRPSFQQVTHQADNTSTVYINPGMGFGTGTHETTRLCLRRYLEIQKKNPLKRILDFGCGSGILGISALKENLDRYVSFVDIDSDALDNCLENINLNFNQNINGDLTIRKRFNVSKKYDLVFANILLNTLKSEVQVYLNSLNESGFLITSGILVNQKTELIDFFKNYGLLFYSSQDEGDWSEITFTRS